MGNDKLFNKYLKIIATFSLFILIQNNWAQTASGKDASVSQYQSMYLVNVTIGGDFPLSGTYPASRTERVDQFITRVSNEYKSEIFRTTPDEKLLGLLKSNIDNFAKRDIILKRFSGEEIKIDLVKFRATGDFNFNPYLNNDDVIIFPALDLERNFIDISGAVNKEIKFQFVDGDKLSDAILFARGLNPAFTNIDSVQISRLSNNGLNEELLNFSLNEDPILLRGDRIKILSDENKKKDYSVLVLGEVKRPGKIYITQNNTTLSEVIKKAGGITENASLKFAEFIRNYNTISILQKKAIEQKLNGVELSLEEEQKLLNIKNLELLKMYRSANITLEDTLFFNIDNSLRVLEGYSQIDFRNLNIPSSLESNYIVKDGDAIVIPEARNEIYVWGGVGNSGYYKFDESKSVKDYIYGAGGYSEIAEGDDELYLIKGKSREWINVTETEKSLIEPGDFLYVKKDPPKSTDFYLYRVGLVAGIFGSVATIYLLLNQIGK